VEALNNKELGVKRKKLEGTKAGIERLEGGCIVTGLPPFTRIFEYIGGGRSNKGVRI